MTRNAVRCRACHVVIESGHRHDFVWCPCGSVAVDGGLAYARICWTDGAAWDELYEYEGESTNGDT